MMKENIKDGGERMSDKLIICKHCYHPERLHNHKRIIDKVDNTLCRVLLHIFVKGDEVVWYCECPGFEELSS